VSVGWDPLGIKFPDRMNQPACRLTSVNHCDSGEHNH
jgi:hypothetical protein